MKNTILLLAVLALSLRLTAQVTVSGVVRSSSDTTALPGVLITELGTGRFATTDNKGLYNIQVASENPVLVFSALGYDDKQVSVGRRSVVGVMLETTQHSINEVVVIGYGQIRKSDLTGSVGTMSSRDIENSTSMSINEIMSGRLAGVNILSTGGEPGAGMTVRVRGSSSINADVEPLYIIDGIPFEKSNTMTSAFGGVGNSSVDPMAQLNPNDIKSVEVLKDASATAIYGSRGANGVIIITTKSGQEGRTNITYSNSMGVSARPQKEIEVLNAMQYADFNYNVMKYGGVSTDGKYITPNGDQVSYADSTGHNWQKEMFRTALQQNHNVSISGGNKQTKYLVSAGYSGQDGIIRNSSYERFTTRMNLVQELTRRLSANVTLTYTKTGQNGSVISSDQGNGSASGVIQQMITFRPVNVGSFDEIDMLESPPVANPLLYNKLAVKKNASTRTQYSFVLNYKLTDDLSLKGSYNGFVNSVRTKEYMPREVGPGYQVNGKNTSGYGTQNKWMVEAFLNYNKKFNKNSRLNAMAGYTMERLDSRTESTTAQNILDGSLGAESIGWGSDVVIPIINNMSQVSLISYLGRANYTYREKYLFTASLRADGSSKFTKDNKFSFFPSVAFAWKAGDEKFLRGVSQISNLKLRTSYGRTGNQSIQPYSTFDRMNLGYMLFSGKVLEGGIYPAQTGNSNLCWETTDQYDAGIDLGLFKNRINLTLDVYNKRTTDLLLLQPVSQTAGVDYIINNIGSVRNRGLEISLNVVPVRNRTFIWESTFNITFNRNKVLDLGSVDYYYVDPSNNTNFINAFIVQKGRSIGTMYGYNYKGVYQYEDFEEFYNVDAATGAMTLKSQQECLAIYDPRRGYTLMPGVTDRTSVNVAPGFAKYEDLDANGIVDDRDRTVIGHSDPLFYGGFSNLFTYKDFDLNIFMQYSYGNQIFNAANSAWGAATRNKNKTVEVWRNMWKPDDPQNGYPYTTDLTGARDIPSTMCVEDGSYIRLSEVTLGYKLPQRIISRAGISSMRVFVSAQNLYVLSSYSYYDPDITSNNPLAAGWDRFSYPRPRTFMGGLSITF
ncbi:SusC/RagA family TonB-linked outer membrane protein [Bacteroidia bacterium]|nr:SusC/RagA family TonB-linked outer membrane protein [Bacteroidia bacterium]